MKTYLQKPDPAGNYLNPFGQRVTLSEVTGPFAGWNGFNPKIYLTKAENEDAAKVAFGLHLFVAPPAKTIAECIVLAERHIEASFSTFILMDGQNRLFAATIANSLSSIPKTVAVATWVETVKGMALAGQSTFPPAPFTTQEVIQEQLP